MLILNILTFWAKAHFTFFVINPSLKAGVIESSGQRALAQLSVFKRTTLKKCKTDTLSNNKQKLLKNEKNKSDCHWNNTSDER